MTISIGGLGSQPIGRDEPAVDQATSARDNRVHNEGDAIPTLETTTLVSSAASLAALTKAATDQPEVRSDKVEQLRQAIAAGTYKIEPKEVANAILEEWQ